MKFKVGDKVRVREDLEIDKIYGRYFINETMKRMSGKIVEIEEVNEVKDCYTIKEDSKVYFWTDEMLEPVEEYTYEDLCKAPIGTKITFETERILIKIEKNFWENKFAYRVNGDLSNLRDNQGCLGKIIKIEEPQYTAVYEAKDILDEKEKEYLSNVIKPFKDKVMCIIKRDNLTDSACEYIEFKVRVNQNFSLPNFKKDTMYRGMKIDKCYLLEELGL